MSEALARHHPVGLTAGEIATAAGGRVVTGDPGHRFPGLAIDSRNVAPGSLFVALPGARVDGHDYLPEALRGGAGGALVSRPDRAGAAAVVIVVPDTLAALQSAAATWRERLRAKVVGIAGSNGKTTTKEVVASVLRARGRTFATPGNENSQVGTPMAILAAPLDTEFLVLELGTSSPGELGRLAAFARPDVAVITAAFAEHLEFLDSLAGVIAAETEILDHLRTGALALVGSEEPDLVTAARRRTALRVETVGRESGDAWRLGGLRLGRDGTTFELREPSGAVPGEWRVPLLGEPAAWAASFAIAIGRALGLGDREIRAGLAAVRPAAHRMAPARHPSRPIFVLDDCYNANPASCRAALRAVAELREPGSRLVVVLGDMLELGESSDDEHRALGAAVAELAPGADLFAIGASSPLVAGSAAARGIRAEHVADASRATPLVLDRVGAGPATVLVKGSRGIALEKIVAAVLSPA